MNGAPLYGYKKDEKDVFYFMGINTERNDDNNFLSTVWKII